LCRPGTATNVMRVLTDSKVPEPVSRSARTWSRASSGTHCSHRRRVGAMSSPGGEGIWLVFKAAPDSGGVAGPVPAMPDDGDLDAAAAHGMPGQGPITQWLAGTTPPSGPCLCRGSSPPGLTALTRRTDHTARRPGRGAAARLNGKVRTMNPKPSGLRPVVSLVAVSRTVGYAAGAACRAGRRKRLARAQDRLAAEDQARRDAQRARQHAWEQAAAAGKRRGHRAAGEHHRPRRAGDAQQKGHVAGYNGQAVVTAEQVIVGAMLSQHPVDRTLLHPQAYRGSVHDRQRSPI